MTIDGKCRPGQRCATQWHLVDAHPNFLEALRIAHHHLKPGHDMVSKAHRLRGLQVGKAWHDGVRVLFRQAQHTAHEAVQ